MAAKTLAEKLVIGSDAIGWSALPFRLLGAGEAQFTGGR